MKANSTHPLSLVQFIISAIDEVAPNLGEEVYWKAFNRYEDYAARRQRKGREKHGS